MMSCSKRTLRRNVSRSLALRSRVRRCSSPRWARSASGWASSQWSKVPSRESSFSASTKPNSAHADPGQSLRWCRFEALFNGRVRRERAVASFFHRSALNRFHSSGRLGGLRIRV